MPKQVQFNAEPGSGLLFRLETLLSAADCKHHVLILSQLAPFDLRTPEMQHIARTVDVLIADEWDIATTTAREALRGLKRLMRDDACIVYCTRHGIPPDAWAELISAR